MDFDDFLKLGAVRYRGPLVAASELSDRTDRTLLFGYTCDRQTFHVYLKDGEINRIVYDRDDNILKDESGEAVQVMHLVPDKRVTRRPATTSSAAY
jgi:hypothetical protein